LVKLAGAAAGAAAISPLVRGGAALAQDDPWTAAVDTAKATEQAKELITYGMPDDWANYGDVYKAFWTSLGITDGKHTDTDMSSLEEITKFDAEKGNPIAMFSDIGMLWGPVAEKKGVVPAYLPPSAEKLPAAYKGATGGWVATFAGVPALVVNNKAIADQGLPAITSWADLLKPEFKGKVGSPGDPRSSGTAQATFIAWAYANGGDSNNMQPAIDYAKQILPQYNAASATVDLLEKGEIVCWIRYDFNCAAAVNSLKEKGIDAAVVIPGVSIYAPSALMVNKYNTGKMDASKAFLDFVLSDAAATAFAKFGARPIGVVLGYQTLPAEATANWLPQDSYKDVKVVDDFTNIDAEKIASTWDEEVLGG
jgi:putative spermidine/putrescine transport system substrate-binding protein